MASIIIVEDDECIREELKQLLVNNGYRAEYLLNFVDAAKQILEKNPDLVLLDVNLPETSGLVICDQIRKVSKIPIIFVTSNKTSMDELNCIMRGGDDYVSKPYQVPILLARISAVLRRTMVADEEKMKQEFECNGVHLKLSSAKLEYKGKEIDLTKNELKILYCLFEHKKEIVSRNELIDFLWDNEVFIDDNSLSVNVTRIRTKLASLGVQDFIETKRGMGYQIG